MKTGKGTSLLTAPAKPHPHEFMTGTNHLISHHTLNIYQTKEIF